MPSPIVAIGNIRRNELAGIGSYRTTNVPGDIYDVNHPYVKSLDEGPTDIHGKSPINTNDSDNYGKVGDYNDIQGRIGNLSPGALQKNKYFRLGNQYDVGDVTP
jgi:hypothetical protein